MGVCTWLMRSGVAKPSTVNTAIKVGKRSGVAVAALIALVGTWEGLRLNAYRDPVGIPTVCYGETKDVKLGDSYTKEICDAMLSDRLQEFVDGMAKCYPDVVKLPDTTYIALVSFSYNVGTGAFCKSTLVKKLKAGDIPGACDQLPRWNKAGGKVLKGLVNRRAAEQKLCHQQANL